MMTDINMWSVPLSQELVASWTACKQEERLQKNKIVDWVTANWTLERIDVITVPKTEVCWETAKDYIYPFPSFEKNFLDSVDFCNILKGTIPVPRSESVMSDMNEACEAPYTGLNFLIYLRVKLDSSQVTTIWRRKVGLWTPTLTR